MPDVYNGNNRRRSILYYFFKIVLSAIVIVIISEVAKRSSLLGATIASLPLTSILAITWLYLDTKNLQKVSDLSYGIFWIVIPSLVFFIALPLFIKFGWNFWLGLTGSIVITAVAYFSYVIVLGKLGIKI